MICKNCGSENSNTARYCGNCGKELKKERGRIKIKLLIAVVLGAIVFGVCLQIWKNNQKHVDKNRNTTTVKKTGTEKQDNETIFTQYLQNTGKKYTELDESYTETENMLKDDTRSIKYMIKKMEELPGTWYVSYTVYENIEGVEDGILIGPTFSSQSSESDKDAVEKKLESIYGSYDEKIESPIENSEIQYKGVLWRNVENGKYSVSLIENDEKNVILFTKPCHHVTNEEIEKVVSKMAKEKYGKKASIKINNWTRILPDYVVSIAVNEMGQEAAETNKKASEYALVNFNLKEDEENQECMVLIQYVNGKWKIFGKIKEVETTSEKEEDDTTETANQKVEENKEETKTKTNMTQEEKIQQIRNVYYDIQGKLSQYTEYTGYEGLQVYYEGRNVKKIVSKNGTTSNPEYVLPSEYSAEFFYDNNTLVFAFVYKGTEEYRFYIDPNDEEKCIRYIGNDGVVQDFEESVNPIEQFGNIGRFCEAGYEEPYWMDIK